MDDFGDGRILREPRLFMSDNRKLRVRRGRVPSLVQPPAIDRRIYRGRQQALSASAL